MAKEHLAREIDAKATVLQSSFGDTAIKDRTLAVARVAQLVGASTTGVSLVGVALTAIATADGSESAGEAVALGLIQAVVCLTRFRSHDDRIGC